jgi:hypothetical protein
MKKSTWLVMVMFICTLITIPSFTTKTEAREVQYTEIFKILEIEPGANQFVLGSGSTSRIYEENIDGLKVQVTRISMAEFISMVDEIRGQYDAVVVGRAKNGLSMNFEVNKPFRDYSPPFYQEVNGKLLYTGADNPSINAHLSGYVYPSQVNVDGNTVNTVDGGKTVIEYYSENDITKKRASEITEMLKSGELVYFANEILDDAMLSTSNLVKIFKNDYTNYSKIKRYSNSEINIRTILDDYNGLQSNIKKPKVTELVISEDDRALDIAKKESRAMNFTLTVNDNEDLTPSLYLDINSDGIYTDNEKVSITFTHTGDKYIISHSMDLTFVGYLDWKIELTRSNKIKTYVTNNSIFKAYNNHYKVINALQIYPNTGTDDQNLYLCPPGGSSTPAQDAFNSMVRNLNLEKLGYKLTITSVPVYSDGGINKLVENKNDYLDQYDMVIVGFADSYGADDQFSPLVTQKLEEFAKSGKAALYTHDTIGLNTFGGNHNDVSEWNMNVGPKLLGQKLRDYLGQSRYKDNYRDGDEKDLDDKTNIEHDELIPAGSNAANTKSDYVTAKNNNTLFSMGSTLYMNEWKTNTETTTVRSINNAQITSFPFDLNQSTINVANTHTQWFQLNLEDPEVVPWYNLSKSNFDSGDSRNFYYTYSKGNITYSGTGHTATNYAEQATELKLFINTIVKASNGGNNKPYTINQTTDNELLGVKEDGTENIPVVKKTEDYLFNAIPKDLDGDRMKLTVKVNGQVLQTDGDYNRIHDNAVQVSIPKAYFENMSNGAFATVETIAEDEFGVVGMPSTFKLQIVANEAPVITNYDSKDVEINENQKIVISKDNNFIFSTKLNDKENDLMSATITLDGLEIASKTNINNDSEKINVTIPSDKFRDKKPQETLKVMVNATDSNGGTSSKGFILEIDNSAPILSHRLIEDNETYFSGTKYVYYFKTLNFSGDITGLYNNASKVDLTILNKDLQIKGDILIYKVKDGTEILPAIGTMTGANGIYTCSLDPQKVGDVPSEGVSLRVKYSAEISKLPPKTETSYINNLSTEGSVGIVTIKTKQSSGTPDLF